ncbi:MAG: cytochrome b N-terminal domain-containing protein [Gammaproteobacteria bacterium]|nr:cytochrome b N-terminal domain-containing protein [Gammaproteobacteria bacterium]
MSGLRTVIKATFESVENIFDRAFGPELNPMHQLGALGWFFYWIVIVSGVYLYIFFDTGIHQAYESLEYITNVQWYAAGVMRSLHRYASDALIIVMMLHLLREFVMDRYRGARWFSWFTGVPLLWFVFACGITGYWMVWDVLAQYIAITTTEWLDTLGIFGETIARNFLNPDILSGRFFTLMVFIHIAVPLFMLLAMWIHIQRQSYARVNPPKGLAIGTLGMLLVLSFIKPAVSQPPADLGIVPAVIDLDWFYLAAYPLLDMVPGLVMWALAAGGTLLLLLLPWLPPRRRETAAVVDLDNCNGCGRCVDDCPFTAVTLQQRTDDSAFSEEAVVSSDLCTSCGICVGACPTATPFRRTSELVPGIDLPDQRVQVLRDDVLAVAAKLSGDTRVIVFGCKNGPDLQRLNGPAVATVELQCMGMLPPSFIDFLITRHHVDGVFLTGCNMEDCHNRLGNRWTEQRLAGERDPYLRERVPRERIGKFWAGLTHNKRLAQQLTAFQAQIKGLPPYHRPSRKSSGQQPVGSNETHG